MEKTTLTQAFSEFIQDLKNVDPKISIPNCSHEDIQKELNRVKSVDLKSLIIFEIPVGHIYKKDTNPNTKRAIYKHLELLNKLVLQPKSTLKEIEVTNDGGYEVQRRVEQNDLPQRDLLQGDINSNILNTLPISNVLTPDNLNKIASLVTQHKQDSDSIIDVLRKVVNSTEFEKVAMDLTKGFKG